jgi:hypothetical protein
MLMMMTMSKIDINELTGNGKIHTLSGHPKGLAARRKFGLDGLDKEGAIVDVVVPDHLYGLSPSFVQGLFTASVRFFGNSRERFFQHYRFQASDLVMRQINRGMDAILTNRTL